MNIEKISKEEKEILYKAADEYQTTRHINITCPRCNGKLKYVGNMSSYRMLCEKQCGIALNVRGI